MSQSQSEATQRSRWNRFISHTLTIALATALVSTLAAGVFAACVASRIAQAYQDRSREQELKRDLLRKLTEAGTEAISSANSLCHHSIVPIALAGEPPERLLSTDLDRAITGSQQATIAEVISDRWTRAHTIIDAQLATYFPTSVARLQWIGYVEDSRGVLGFRDAIQGYIAFCGSLVAAQRDVGVRILRNWASEARPISPIARHWLNLVNWQHLFQADLGARAQGQPAYLQDVRFLKSALIATQTAIAEGFIDEEARGFIHDVFPP